MNNDDNNIYFERGENYQIPDKAKVTVTDYDYKVEVKRSWRRQKNLRRYKRIEKNHFMDLQTGEIKKYKNKNKFKTNNEITKAMKELKELILYNFKGNPNELFITFTCEENITNLKEIKRYMKYFIKRLKRKYDKKKFEYIYKFEKMKNGRWHIHLLIKDTKNKSLYIKNSEIEKIWKKGLTKTKRISKENPINGKNGIAGYMAKLTQLKEVPIGEKLFIKSRGIKKPKKEEMFYEEAEKKVKDDYDLIYEKTTLVKSKSTNKIINSHKKEVYMKKPKK